MTVITCHKIVVIGLISFIPQVCETVNMYTIFAVSILGHLENLGFLFLFLSFSAFLYVPPIATPTSEFNS